MKKYDVSIICCTYNSDINKLAATLKSLINQEECKFEIIIADDGSLDNHEEFICNYFKKFNFQDYKLCLNKNNEGTVKNIFEALKLAEGEYVKPISPGDYLYCRTTLKDLIAFAKQNTADIVFGDAVYYTYKFLNINILQKRAPIFNNIYTNDNLYDFEQIVKYQIYYGDFILGASLLYKTTLLYKYLYIIKNFVVYTEDTVIQLFALKKHKIYYFGEFIIWYEADSGISTNSKRGFGKKIKNDLFNFYKLMRTIDNKFYIKYAYYNAYFDLIDSNKLLKIIYKVLNAFCIDKKIFKYKRKQIERKLINNKVEYSYFYNWIEF